MAIELQGFLKRQRISVTLLMLMGLLVFSAEGLVYYYEEAPTFIIAYSVSSAVFCAINLVILKVFEKDQLSVFLTLLLVFATLGFLVKTGGQDGTGIFWAVSTPLIFFLLTGKRRGLGLSVFLLLIVLVALVLDYFQFLDAAFNLVEMREPALIYFVVMICSYTMEHFRELGEQSSWKTSKETSGMNKQLENEIQGRKRIESQLKKHGEEVEKLNKLMIGRELKMVEMKKELDLLKGKSTKE